MQNELQRIVPCEVTLWTQGVFRASQYTMEGLAGAARQTDFAVLVAVADTNGGAGSTPIIRENVIFELGLFMGTLGRERTYIVADRRDGALKLPSDLDGLTWLPYEPRADGNQRAAVNDAALKLAEEIRELGVRTLQSGHDLDPGARSGALAHEIDLICSAAKAQGWQIKTNTATALRLISPDNRKFSLSMGEPHGTRLKLRQFVRQLRANGMRVSASVRRPPDESPW